MCQQGSIKCLLGDDSLSQWSQLCHKKVTWYQLRSYKLKEHFGQQMDSLLLAEYWCNSHFLAKFMAQSWAAINPAQDQKWPIPLECLLAGSVSLTCQNLSPIAHHISPGRASKDGRFSEALYMEYALMQQPGHIQAWKLRRLPITHYIILLTDITTYCAAFSAKNAFATIILSNKLKPKYHIISAR